MTDFTATYSPEDNKIRLYCVHRLDSETYQRAKACKFNWAPKQELFYAHWNPAAEDFALELAGIIDDEAMSVADRAAIRAERFEEYGSKRASEADSAYNHSVSLSEDIPLGQPILVGHHSERKARKHAEKIERAMDNAIRLWDTSKYWEQRAKGVISSANYKERAEVRARRIKKLEAEERKARKIAKEALNIKGLWEAPELTRDDALKIANYFDHFSMCFTLEDYPRDYETYEGAQSLWGALDKGIITAEQARDLTIPSKERTIAHYTRCAEHDARRITYERAILAAQGGLELLDPPKRKKQPPMLNYRQPEGFEIVNKYNRDTMLQYPQVSMTKAEYAKIYRDYKGTELVNGHRVRTAMVSKEHPDMPEDRKGGYGGTVHCAVFLTDSKEHPKPDTVPLDFSGAS